MSLIHWVAYLRSFQSLNVRSHHLSPLLTALYQSVVGVDPWDAVDLPVGWRWSLRELQGVAVGAWDVMMLVVHPLRHSRLVSRWVMLGWRGPSGVCGYHFASDRPGRELEGGAR